MKRFLATALASAGLMVMAAGAQAQTWNGPEVGVQGGYGWGQSSGDIRTLPGNFLKQSYEFSPDGGMGGGHAGYNWQFGHTLLGVEGDVEGGDLFGRRDKFGTLAGGGAEFKTRLDFDASVRGKIGYAFDRVLLYGTGGVAFGDVHVPYESGVGCAANFSCGTSDTMRVGWTAGGGLGYAITPRWSANIEYRYTDLGSHGFTSVRYGFHDDNSFNYNMVRLGVSYRFASPPPPPPPMATPMPAAAPAAAPPPPPRTFLVFFDFDRYNLTPDARKVIRSAADTYKQTGAARLEVSGYTDLAGTQAYNLRLSRRRADAVSAYMARLGVPRNVMDVKWFGKEHPRVPTPDGVREPQNRRVEIVMP